MKYVLAICLLVIAVGYVHGAAATASSPPPVKSLIFGDEFNGAAGTQPSHRVWESKHFDNWTGWTHIAENGSGSVLLTAYKDSNGWHTPWLSGRIGYRGPRYIEARAEVPCGAGTWSAPIWEWRYPYGRTPGFENDVSEQLGKEPSQYHVTLHRWTSSGRNYESSKEFTATSTLCGTYHTYGAAVFSNRVDFYLDGALTTSISASAVGLSNLTRWKQVINIDLAMGGMGGNITVSSPVVLAVDYIHVYRI